MTISLSAAYYASTDTALLGYVGEHHARTIHINGLDTDGADRYKLRIEYADGVSYEVDITGGEYLIDGSLLRSPQTVRAQIYALKTNGDNYELVKKSQIFTLKICPALESSPAPIPTYEASREIADKLMDAGIIADKTEVITDEMIRRLWEELP